jgi:inactivated superfamily I helicase
MIEAKHANLQKDIAELLDAIDDNELDEIKLKESTGLWSKYTHFQQTLEFYEWFSMIEQKIALDHEPDCADQVILIALAMLIIQRRKTWGNYVPN